MTPARKLRVAVAGTGYFSRFHYDAWARIGEIELIACADRDMAKAQEMAMRHVIPHVFDDVVTMLDATSPDVLDIVTPPATHLDTIKLAAARGISIICQKAFCRSLAEARAAVQIAKAAGITAIVHENFRFQPWHREAKRLIEAGRIGAPYQVTFLLRPGDGQGPQAYLDRQPYFQHMPRFLVHETAIHFIDTFRYLMGDVRAVYADLRRINPAIAGEDAGTILFEFASGARGAFDGNRLADHRAANRRLTMGEMLIEGSAGTLRLDGDGGLFMRAHGSNDEAVVSYAWENTGFAGDCVYRLQSSAVAALLGRHAPENTAEDYLANLVIEKAVYQSATERRRIEVG